MLNHRYHFGFSPIVVVAAFGLVAVALVASLFLPKKKVLAPTTSNAVVRMCTTDAKQCPGGSYVARQGPKCEFAPCPATNSASPQTQSIDTSSWQTKQLGALKFKIPPDWWASGKPQDTSTSINPAPLPANSDVRSVISLFRRKSNMLSEQEELTKDLYLTNVNAYVNGERLAPGAIDEVVRLTGTVHFDPKLDLPLPNGKTVTAVLWQHGPEVYVLVDNYDDSPETVAILNTIVSTFTFTN